MTGAASRRFPIPTENDMLLIQTTWNQFKHCWHFSVFDGRERLGPHQRFQHRTRETAIEAGLRWIERTYGGRAERATRAGLAQVAVQIAAPEECIQRPRLLRRSAAPAAPAATKGAVEIPDEDLDDMGAATAGMGPSTRCAEGNDVMELDDVVLALGSDDA